MRIAVIGCGYVGLVTGSCLAEAGHDVVATDIDLHRIATLNDGRLPIHEPGLDVVMERARAAGRLRFSHDCAEAIDSADAIFICVGTPPLESGEADLSAIDNVAQQIGSASRSSKLVIEKSTVPARTGERLREALNVYGRKNDVTFRVASNPEFLREGTGVSDFYHPDRIVVGVEDEESALILREIYKPILERRFFCPAHPSACPSAPAPAFLVTTLASAELIKHVSNSFLGLKISYANAVADMCEHLGANVDDVMQAVGMDSRIGRQFLNAGLGFGGFCLPKDIQAFVHLANREGVDFSLLKEVDNINKRRIDQFMKKVHAALWVMRDKEVGVLGLAFKPNTDDIRFSPAIEVARRLQAGRAVVRATDPVAIDRARAVLPGVNFIQDPYEVARGADALLLLTEWKEYKGLDWERIFKSMARPLVLDARNMLSPGEMKAIGFEYHSFGRPVVNAATPVFVP
jgi:UDPglucose 6-dehydrogenase